LLLPPGRMARHSENHPTWSHRSPGETSGGLN
jgi:hypothetical protein